MSFSKLGIRETSTYLNEVFGRQEGDIYEGLLDACSEDDFDARLLSLREFWAKREKCTLHDSKVYQWFIECKTTLKWP